MKATRFAMAAFFWALRLGIGGLFVITGALKIADPAAFAIEIHNYQLMTWLAPWMAATLPAIEIVLGAALIAGPRAWARASALATGALMAAFTIAVASVLGRGINISCGCFGAGSGPVTIVTLLRDVALLGGCALIYAMAASPSREPTR